MNEWVTGLFFNLFVIPTMSQSAIAQAIKNLCEEKKIPFDVVIEALEAALAAAYRKDFGKPNQNIKVKFDPEAGGIEVTDIKEVVQDFDEEALAKQAEIKETKESRAGTEEGKEEVFRFNPKTHIMVSEAKKTRPDIEIGQTIVTTLEVPGDFGRMAAQTAKQVITQKLREAERNIIFEEFKDKVNELLIGTVQRKEGRNYLLDLNRAIAVLPYEEQIPTERYHPGTRIKVYVQSVNMTPKGPEIIVSRAHPQIVKKLFTFEIPEVNSGVIEIISVAREAGSRTKIAVKANDPSIDPIGSCVGQRGSRIQTIINELGGEKVDVIEYSDDIKKYLMNALNPAKVLSIDAFENDKRAIIHVAKDQLSLAIGRSGQNVRLASKLTGWNINIEEVAQTPEAQKEDATIAPVEPSPSDEPKETAEDATQ